MKEKAIAKVILWTTVPVIILLVVTSLNSLLSADPYSKETLNWRIQSIGQDLINLFVIVPALLASLVISLKGKRAGSIIWAGTILYLLYTFLIYCFSLHFNNMFLAYCIILGIAFYAFNYYMYIHIRKPMAPVINKSTTVKAIAVYFLVIPFIFYVIWLSEIIPAIFNSIVPSTIVDSGLFTNPVHVIDLSVFLPGIFITGILLLKRAPLGILLTPVILTFFVLMDVTIAFLVFKMNANGIGEEYSIAYVMLVLAAFSIFLLIRYLSLLERAIRENGLLAGISPLEGHKFKED